MGCTKRKTTKPRKAAPKTHRKRTTVRKGARTGYFALNSTKTLL